MGFGDLIARIVVVLEATVPWLRIWNSNVTEPPGVSVAVAGDTPVKAKSGAGGVTVTLACWIAVPPSGSEAVTVRVVPPGAIPWIVTAAPETEAVEREEPEVSAA